MLLYERPPPNFIPAPCLKDFNPRHVDGSRSGTSVIATANPSYESRRPYLEVSISFQRSRGFKGGGIFGIWKGVVARASNEEKEREAKSARSSALRCLSKISTVYNQIVILEVPERSSSEYAGKRVLLLDHSGNVHSVYKRDSAWTSLYWDEFASLPAIIPVGPVAIFGLGGGTTARLLLHLWPGLRLEGFEIDEILVDQARLLLGLSDLEVPTSQGGCLTVHISDALPSSATVDGGFAGIIVDIFSGGEVPVELKQPQTWLDLQNRLRPGGRIMVNCGGICVEKGDPKSDVEDGTWTWEDGGSSKDATLSAMVSAFQGQLSWRTMDSEADNLLALSGPFPDLEFWAAALPERLKEGVFSWRPYNKIRGRLP